jgi:hypothetical protein
MIRSLKRLRASWIRTAAWVTGIYSCAAAASVTCNWFFPKSIRPASQPLLALGLLVLSVAGISAAFRGRKSDWWPRSDSFRARLVEIWRGPPTFLAPLLLLSCLIVGTSAVVGLVETRGFSADLPGQDPQCHWTIAKDHGRDIRCVTEAEWQRVADGGQLTVLGVEVLAASCACILSARWVASLNQP